MSEVEKSSSPWDDPNVKAHLEEGKNPDEIYLFDCPDCGLTSYYNEGSHFTCRHCNRGFLVIDEDEEWPIDGHRFIFVTASFSLADYTDQQVSEEIENR